MASKPFSLIVILGPTASGKTSVAAHLASRIYGEIISADSRQIYRGLNLGTGKDYDDYIVNGETVPFHLLDIAEPGSQYNVFEYQKDFFKTYNNVLERKKVPILCGGSGMYLEAVLEGYELIQVPVDENLRKELENKTIEELVQILESYRNVHATTDTLNKKRTIRAIEIERYQKSNPVIKTEFPEITPLLIGIRYSREVERERITQRLQQRLSVGLIDEVEFLLKLGITPEQLLYYGLEYKFITLFVLGELTYTDMFTKLNTAIHQFAKRQMTWFRRMEKKGYEIHWIDGNLPMSDKLEAILKFYKN